MSVDEILKAAETRVDEAEVCISSARILSADLKREKIEIGSMADESGIVIRVITDGKIGISSTDNPAMWQKCLDAAIASARFSDRVDWKGLPGPENLPRERLAYDPEVRPEPGLLRDLIDRMLSGASAHQAEATGGGASALTASHAIANSNGLYYEAEATSVSLSLEMIAGRSTGYEHESSWQLKTVRPEWIGEQAAFFASKGQEGEEIATGSYDIVLSPSALASLLDATVIPAFSGRNVHTGRSCFATKMGEQVMGSQVSLFDDPFDSRGIANNYWDGEGMPVKKTAFVQDGVLSSYAYDLKTAYRYGAEPTGHAVRSGMGGAPSIGHHNLVLTAAEMDVMAEDAIYVRDLIGAHTANPMSGDYSVELSSPFFISGGELDTPIRTAMLSGNVFDLLGSVQGCSSSTRTMGSLILPQTRCSGVSIVGRG